MVKSVLADLLQVYRKLYQQAWPLLQVSAIWLVLALMGQLMSGMGNMMTPESVPPTALPGAIVHVLALLIGWYSAHRYMINPAAGVRLVPAPAVLRFIGVQVLVVALLTLVVLIPLIPLMIAAMPALDAQLSDAELRQATDAATRPYLPLFYIGTIWLFGRLLLVAPMLVRDQARPMRQSWRKTKGHMIRLFVLQLGVMAPVWVGAELARLLLPVHVLSVLVGLVGVYLTVLAYTQLAEDEYAKLAG